MAKPTATIRARQASHGFGRRADRSDFWRGVACNAPRSAKIKRRLFLRGLGKWSVLRSVRRHPFRPGFGVLRPLRVSRRLRGPFYPRHYTSSARFFKGRQTRCCVALAACDYCFEHKRLVEDEDCLSCRCLSICHGGCPVRTYSALGTMMAKDPYCEVYKAVFACAEAHGREILRRGLAVRKPPSAESSQIAAAM